jgi:predicted RNase H-like nuclease
MEITVTQFRKCESLLRRRLITAPHPPLAILQLRNAVDAKCARNLKQEYHDVILLRIQCVILECDTSA